MMLGDPGMISGVFSSVFVRLLVASLPPTCHRTRPKDAKTRPLGPGRNISSLAFLSGEGGDSNPRYAKSAQWFLGVGPADGGRSITGWSR